MVGFLVVLALSRVLPDPAGTPPGSRSGGARWRASFDDLAEPGTPAAGLRIVHSAPPVQARTTDRRAA